MLDPELKKIIDNWQFSPLPKSGSYLLAIEKLIFLPSRRGFSAQALLLLFPDFSIISLGKKIQKI